MQHGTSPRSPGLWSGYLWSVTIATLILIALDVDVELGCPTLETLPNLFKDLEELVKAAAAVWLLCLFSALIPFIASVKVASRFNIRSGCYYAACGILTGLLLTAIYVAIAQSVEVEQSFLSVGGLFVASALSGAMTYWWRRGRRAGLSQA